MDDSTNDRNDETTWFNIARDNNINVIICKKPGHVAKNCCHLTKAKEAVSKKQNPDFSMQNQQLSNNYQQRENKSNNSARNTYRNNYFLANRNNNYYKNDCTKQLSE